tara:strand:+ start:2839 stop:3807 length:969 start_codon:yes stop_codon:yes gene_type:complete
MLLAGDIGGTKTLLGLFDPSLPRPKAITTRTYQTNKFSSFLHLLDEFKQDVAWMETTIEAIVFGVAGPVLDQKTKLTNIPWNISGVEISKYYNLERVRLINDLEAIAHSIEVLDQTELFILQAGKKDNSGNAVIIAAGTGLGEVLLHRVNGKLTPIPSEGGHADFAPRTNREKEFVRTFQKRYGRVTIEQVLSGRGLINLYHFTHAKSPCDAIIAQELTPALVSQAGLQANCSACAETLELFVSAYGSETGNLALRGVASSGVFIGGGIAPKILQPLSKSSFMEAFRDKPPMTKLLSQFPVKVILNEKAGLVGAAVFANVLW